MRAIEVCRIQRGLLYDAERVVLAIAKLVILLSCLCRRRSSLYTSCRRCSRSQEH